MNELLPPGGRLWYSYRGVFHSDSFQIFWLKHLESGADEKVNHRWVVEVDAADLSWMKVSGGDSAPLQQSCSEAARRIITG